MLRFAVLALLVAAASAGVSPAINPLTSVKGPIGGIVPCGSQGQVLEIRVSDCDGLPCHINIGSNYTIEADFIPARAHDALTVLVSILEGGSEHEIVHDTVPAVVSPGNAYTLSYVWLVRAEAPLGNLAIRIQLTDGDFKELCGLATVVVHGP